MKQQVNKLIFPLCGLGKKKIRKRKKIWSRSVSGHLAELRKKTVRYIFQPKVKHFETFWKTSIYKIKCFDALKCYPASKFWLNNSPNLLILLVFQSLDFPGNPLYLEKLYSVLYQSTPFNGNETTPMHWHWKHLSFTYYDLHFPKWLVFWLFNLRYLREI